jgi:alkylation response protein AidB-like acyl-CoA dehydrogenase
MLDGVSSSSTDEQRSLRKAVAGLMAKRSSEQQVRQLMATDAGYDVGVWREMAEMGLLGLLIPEDYGGAGAGHVEVGIVVEEMGRALMCSPYFATAVLAPGLLAESGDVGEQKTVLPRIAAGELIVSLAYAECGQGSARLPEMLLASASADGDGWRISGVKTYVLDAQSADLIYVLAQADSGAGVFAVDRAAAGMSITTLTTVDQTRKQCHVEFVNTPARQVGTPGGGDEAFRGALDRAAPALAGEQAGGAMRAMEMAVEYAKNRYQFGRAIGSFQAVKHMCADMLLEAESAVSAARHAADSFDTQAPDLALAQAYCSEAFVFVAATNIQIHGGIGFTWEHPAHLYLRRARTDAQLLGSPAWHRERYLQLSGA